MVFWCFVSLFRNAPQDKGLSRKFFSLISFSPNFDVVSLRFFFLFFMYVCMYVNVNVNVVKII